MGIFVLNLLRGFFSRDNRTAYTHRAHRTHRTRERTPYTRTPVHPYTRTACIARRASCTSASTSAHVQRERERERVGGGRVDEEVLCALGVSAPVGCVCPPLPPSPPLPDVAWCPSGWCLVRVPRGTSSPPGVLQEGGRARGTPLRIRGAPGTCVRLRRRRRSGAEARTRRTWCGWRRRGRSPGACRRRRRRRR